MYTNSHKKHCILLIRVTTFIDEHLYIIPSKILYTGEDPHQGLKHLYIQHAIFALNICGWDNNGDKMEQSHFLPLVKYKYLKKKILSR